MSRVRIDLLSGTIEAEGSEEFVRDIYQDFRERLERLPAASATSALSAGQGEHAGAAAGQGQQGGQIAGGGVPAVAGPSSAKPAARPRGPLSIVKDLDLSGQGTELGLRAFYEARQPLTAMERNVVFVYYLQRIMQLKGVTLDHVYTCYRDVGVKPPAALKQSLADTSSRRGWLDTSNFANIRISARGTTFVEYDLPHTP